MTSYSTNNKPFPDCVIDSNVFVGYFYRDDPLHNEAKKLFQSLRARPKQFNWLVVSEVGSVMLLRSNNQNLTNEVVGTLLSPLAQDLVVQDLSTELRQKTINIFTNQRSSKLSITDCSLIAQARMSSCDTIVSFDKDLRREFRNKFDFLPKIVRA